MWWCELCEGVDAVERFATVDDVVDHIRVMHPGVMDDGVERWPDGGVVVRDDLDTIRR
jgi:hypothetical protein